MLSGTSVAVPIISSPCARPGARVTLPATAPTCHAPLQKAHVALHLPGAIIAFATRSEGHDPARDQDRAGAWQRRKQGAVRVRRDKVGDPPIEGGDGAAESRQ